MGLQAALTQKHNSRPYHLQDQTGEGRAGQELEQNYARQFFRLHEFVHRKIDPQGRTI